MAKRILYLSSLFLIAACGSSTGHQLPEVDCESGDIESFGQVEAFQSVCVNCHSSELSGAARSEAPVGYDFNIYAPAQDEAEEIAAEVFEGKMPPDGSGYTLTEAQKTSLYRWALCGTPQ